MKGEREMQRSGRTGGTAGMMPGGGAVVAPGTVRDFGAGIILKTAANPSSFTEIHFRTVAEYRSAARSVPKPSWFARQSRHRRITLLRLFRNAARPKSAEIVHWRNVLCELQIRIQGGANP